MRRTVLKSWIYISWPITVLFHMKRIIVAGSRAPVALDMIRKLKRADFQSESLDCIRFPLARFSHCSDRFHLCPSPRFNNQDFEAYVLSLLKSNDIHQIIPTCEEAFYFSKLKTKHNLDQIFVDEFSKMDELHHKWTFSKMSKKWSIQTPETFLLNSASDTEAFHKSFADYVFKPVYSRFASKTIVNANEILVREIDFSAGSWVAQKKIKGLEICMYGVSVKGKLTAFCAYLPKYRVGVGAGIYLERYNDPRLISFAQEFAASINYHGQFAFDFILDENNQYHLLECNPRSTSGVHFFNNDKKFVAALLGMNDEVYVAESSPNRMIGAAVVIFAASSELLKGRALSFVKNFYIGKDIIWSFKDPLPFFGQFVTLFGFFIQAIKKRRSIHQVSSEDFEYNGEGDV